MIRGRGLGKGAEAEENVFWTTMSDLLLGLAIIFIVLFVLAMTGFSQAKVEEQNIKTEVANELKDSLKKQNIDAQIDDLTGDVKLSDLQLFELGSYELSPSGRQFLNKFIPIYINVVFDNSNHLLSNGIKIQYYMFANGGGHKVTDDDVWTFLRKKAAGLL